MRGLYESILDDDTKIKKDIDEFTSDAGRIVRALIDCFYNKFSWDVNSIKYLGPNWNYYMFGIQFNVFDKYYKQFQQRLKKEGFKFTIDDHYPKDFTINKFDGPKGFKIEMSFVAYSDHTYVSVKANSANKKALIDMFDRYKKLVS